MVRIPVIFKRKHFLHQKTDPVSLIPIPSFSLLNWLPLHGISKFQSSINLLLKFFIVYMVGSKLCKHSLSFCKISAFNSLSKISSWIMPMRKIFNQLSSFSWFIHSPWNFHEISSLECPLLLSY